MKKIAIIGGGIIGQFTAYYLSKSGYEVTVIDDAPQMPPASSGNCGLITPSHILPMNSWGTIWQGIKWLRKKDAPLSIKPQFDRTFISWFFDFARYSTKSCIGKITNARHELLQFSRNLYEEFFDVEINKSEWKMDGLLYACQTTKGMEGMKHEVGIQEKYGLESKMLSKQELLEIEPSINEKAVGGAIFEVDGWLNPTQLLADIKQINSTNGVHFIEIEVSGFDVNEGKIKSIIGSGVSVEADEFVLCAGAKSVHLAQQLGIRLKMIPGKGYNITAHEPLTNQPKIPIVMVEKMVVITPWETGFRLGSTIEFSGFDLSLNEQRLQALKNATTDYLDVELENVEFTPWAGWRPMTSNGLPIIERSTKHKNLIIATGHGMQGLSMAPATGKMVEEIINTP